MTPDLHQQGFAITPSQVVPLTVLGDTVRILLSSKETNSGLTLVQITSAVGCGVPWHVHANEDETFYIIKGSVEFSLPGKTIVAHEGETVFAPRKIAHTYRVVGSEPATFNVTVTPGGLDEMFPQLATLPNPPDFGRVAAICEEFGIQFLKDPNA